MKILQIIPALELAGAQTMLENLIYELIKYKNINVEVVSLYNTKSAITDRLERKGIKIYYLGKRKGLDISIFIKLARIIKKFKPDVIHTHIYTLSYVYFSLKLIGMSKKVKIIHTVHNVAKKEVPSRIQKLYNIFFKKENIVPVAISEQVHNSIISRYNLKNDEVPIIYNGVNLKKCKIKDDYKFNNFLLHIGRFSEQKNHEELIDAFEMCLQKNANLKLYLVGIGEKKDMVEDKVRNMGLEKNVIFMGALPSCYEIMNKADIFLLPSKWEGMPMTLIEAMATGLPCIAYPVGGIPDIIENDVTGSLPKNVEELSECILKYSNSKEIRKKIGKNAQKYSKLFSSENMCKRYLKLYCNKWM